MEQRLAPQVIDAPGTPEFRQIGLTGLLRRFRRQLFLEMEYPRLGFIRLDRHDEALIALLEPMT